jgi:hypothetical protein
VIFTAVFDPAICKLVVLQHIYPMFHTGGIVPFHVAFLVKTQVTLLVTALVFSHGLALRRISSLQLGRIAIGLELN